CGCGVPREPMARSQDGPARNAGLTGSMAPATRMRDDSRRPPTWMLTTGTNSSRVARTGIGTRCPGGRGDPSSRVREGLMSDGFANRVALVTGGSRGIGRSTALRLAREGADVAVSYASRCQEAEQVVAEIRDLGRKAICVPCNVARPDEVDCLV